MSDAQPEIEILYDQPEFGTGEMPAELTRLNWSAAFWGWLWAGAYGVWRWFWLLAAVGAVRGVSVALLFSGVVPGLWPWIGLTAEVVSWGAVIAFAFSANATLWRLEATAARRPALVRPAGQELERYVTAQRMGGFAGLSVSALGYLLGLVALITREPAAVNVALAVYVAPLAIPGVAGIWDLVRERARRKAQGSEQA